MHHRTPFHFRRRTEVKLRRAERPLKTLFETQIHIQTHIRYFKSLHIATSYLTTIHLKNLYPHSKTYIMGLKRNSYLMSLSRRDLVNPSSPTFANINLTETMTNVIVAWKSNQDGCKNLYLHPKSFKITFKSNSYPMSISRRRPVTSSAYFSKYQS